tara:strand:- start:4368 stop:5867 length:1500 start_codon:yes stop_codon:yes gene_type:complete
MSILQVKKKNHAFITVDGEPSALNELSDFFTFFVPGYKFMPAYRNKVWDGKIRLFNIHSKELYAGLYPYIEEFAGVEGRNYKIELEHDNYYGYPNTDQEVDMSFLSSYNLTTNGKQIQIRDYQYRAIEYCLANKGALLLSPTASGKSLIIYCIARWYLENYNKRVLIVVPTTSLVQQMYSDFADYSTDDIGFEDSCMHRIYAGRPKFADKEKIVISTWQSIYKMPGTWFEQFGCVFGDEAHNFKAKSLTSILSKMRDTEYRFGTTGTLDGSQTHQLVLEGLFGKIIKVTSTKELIDTGNLAELNINVLLLKYSDELCKAMNGQKYQEEVDFIVKYQPRNRFITNLALDQDGNSLILFQYVEKHGKPLYDMIKNKAHKSRKIFYVSGETGVDTREAVRNITENEKNAIIVASMGVFSTGINIRNLHNIIFSSPSKSQIRILQSIGRGLRKSDDGRPTTLYDLADDLHWKKNKNFTLNHAAERIKIYSKEKFKYSIHELDI